MAQGKTREQAEADFDRVSANNYISKDGRIYEELTPSHILYIDGKPVTIAEIQADPAAYHERVCSDPKEPNYRSKNCAIIYHQRRADHHSKFRAWQCVLLLRAAEHRD